MSSLKQLLARPDLWRLGDRQTPASTGLPTGFAGLDKLLQSGGWPRSALVELVLPRMGVGELRLLMPTLACLAEQGLWQVWIDPPLLPFAPGCLQQGVGLERLLLVRTRDRRQWLWATEQALRAPGCAVVLSWSGQQRPRYAELRKLQVAASERQCTGFLLSQQRVAETTSPAALRLQLRPDLDGTQVHILKQRGRQAGQQWLMPVPALLQAQVPLRERPYVTRAEADPLPTPARLPVAMPPVQSVVWQ